MKELTPTEEKFLNKYDQFLEKYKRSDSRDIKVLTNDDLLFHNIPRNGIEFGYIPSVSSFPKALTHIRYADIVLYFDETTGKVICLKNKYGPDQYNTVEIKYSRLQKFIKKLFKI